jgi:Ser/Thr protein kinase RdoA (MazF antagonist)
VKKPGGGEEQTFVRLLKFIEGSTLMHAAPSPQLYHSVGAFAAKMDQVLFPTTFGHNTTTYMPGRPGQGSVTRSYALTTLGISKT